MLYKKTKKNTKKKLKIKIKKKSYNCIRLMFLYLILKNYN